MSEAYDEGYSAYQRWNAYVEEASSSNPYEDDTPEYMGWEAGWNDASLDADNINPALKGKEI